MKDTYPCPGLSSSIPFWIISGPWSPRCSKWSVLVPYWTIFVPFREVGTIYPHLEINVRFPAQLRLHSKWLSIRNSFGITPKGPMGPSPQGRRRRPWVPFGPLWVPLVSLAPPPLPWVPPKGSAPCRSDIGASRKFGDGAAFAGENKLGRRACAEREESLKFQPKSEAKFKVENKLFFI